MPTHSPYTAVNERRRKRRWNNRSTAQLRRRRAERLADLRSSEDRTANPHGRKRYHGLVNSGYLQSLLREREEILQEVRAQNLRSQGLTPVRAHEREQGAVPVVAHVRAAPEAAPGDDGVLRCSVCDRPISRYLSELRAHEATHRVST